MSDSSKSSDRLQLSLLDNALNFLLSAAEYVKRGSHDSLKYSVLHLIVGIELLLKARLELVHGSFLFADVDKANKNALKSGDFRSVDFETACNRLESFCSIRVPSEVKALRKLRNKFEHFVIDIEVREVKSLLSRNLNFAVEFCKAELKDQVDVYEELTSLIIEYLREFHEFVSERLVVIQRELKESTYLQECPLCWQETLDSIEGGRLRCYFCGHELDANTVAEEHSEDSVDTCPECGTEALAFVVCNNEEAGWHCYFCGEEFDSISYRNECGQAFEDKGLPICDTCFANSAGKD